MREILFRGKRIDNGEWAYGYFVSQDKESYIFEQKEVDKGIDLGGYLDCCQMYEVIPKTVGQSTGLTDKNGNKIFEGDIVDISDTDSAEFLYSYSNLIPVDWCYQVSGFDPFANYDSDCGVFTEAFKSIVVGNVHDNPELLEVK